MKFKHQPFTGNTEFEGSEKEFRAVSKQWNKSTLLIWLLFVLLMLLIIVLDLFTGVGGFIISFVKIFLSNIL